MAHAQKLKPQNAKAQAAKPRLAYAKKEIDIKMERARLEVALDLLNIQK